MRHNNKIVANFHKTEKLLVKKTTNTNKLMLTLLRHLIVELNEFGLFYHVLSG